MKEMKDKNLPDHGKKTLRKPPPRSRNVFTDIQYFFFHKPEYKTVVNFESEEDRQSSMYRILQRTGVGMEKYRILNIHKIGVEAPASYLFEEIMRWNGDSSCWPNHIANVNLVDDHLDKIKVFLFGRIKWPFGKKYRELGFRLFNMRIIRAQVTPDRRDLDNARYLLYECSGGYPIGVFSMYARSSIPEMNESEMSQLFIAVGFNFYGTKFVTSKSLFYRLWKPVHNRVTSNVANRFKQLCEWRFNHFMEG